MHPIPDLQMPILPCSRAGISKLNSVLGENLDCSLFLQTKFYWNIVAEVQPWLIQGVRSGDSVGEDQDTIASIRY